MNFTTWYVRTQHDWIQGEPYAVDPLTNRQKKIVDGYDVRQGQFFFNRLYEEKPELANGLRGSLQDPFYDDNRIPGFLTTVGDLWDEPFGDDGEPLA